MFVVLLFLVRRRLELDVGVCYIIDGIRYLRF